MSLTASSSAVTLAKSQVVNQGLAAQRQVAQLNALFNDGGTIPVRNQTNPTERVPSITLTADDIADAFGTDATKLKAAAAAFIAALA